MGHSGFGWLPPGSSQVVRALLFVGRTQNRILKLCVNVCFGRSVASLSTLLFHEDVEQGLACTKHLRNAAGVNYYSHPETETIFDT